MVKGAALRGRTGAHVVKGAACGRGGFTLVEALMAVLLVGVAALAAASAEAWAARTLAAAEAREDAAAAAELAADSLALEAAPTDGRTTVDGQLVQWQIASDPRNPLARTVRIGVRPAGRTTVAGEELFGAILALPPPSLEESP